jgi:hypothetical protein
MDVSIQAVIIGGLAGLLTGAIPVIYQAWRDKKRQPQEDISTGMEASKSAAEAVITYSGELRKVRLEYETLRAEVVKLHEERQEDKQLIAEWQYGIDRLIGQIISLDHVPVWRPTIKAKAQ